MVEMLSMYVQLSQAAGVELDAAGSRKQALL
jgi:hypothetical protein